MSLQLDQLPVSSLKGVGEAVAAKLAGLGIRSVQDVLFHLPHRYQDRTRLTPIGALQPGREAVISGEVIISEVVVRARRSLLVRIADGTGSIVLRFFHFSQAQSRQFAPGTRLQCFGEARRGPGMLEMVHPEYRLASQGAALQNTLTPFYPATDGLQQTGLRKLTDQALALLADAQLADWLPPAVLDELGFPPLRSALDVVHRPPPGIDVSALLDGLHPALRRLAFEELVAHRLGLRRLRATALQREAPQIVNVDTLADRLLASLSFTLTGAQARGCSTRCAGTWSGRNRCCV